MAAAPLQNNVAAHMRLHRASRGWSQATLAEMLTALGMKIHQTGLARIETGERGLYVDELGIIAACFGIRDPWKLTSEPSCPVCGGSPPRGFTCNACGLGGTGGLRA